MWSPAWWLPAVAVLWIATIGCGPVAPAGETATRDTPRSVPAQREDTSDLPLIVALGDSLTAGLGLSPS